jgi:hypothetical protein
MHFLTSVTVGAISMGNQTPGMAFDGGDVQQMKGGANCVDSCRLLVGCVWKPKFAAPCWSGS